MFDTWKIRLDGKTANNDIVIGMISFALLTAFYCLGRLVNIDTSIALITLLAFTVFAAYMVYGKNPLSNVILDKLMICLLSANAGVILFYMYSDGPTDVKMICVFVNVLILGVRIALGGWKLKPVITDDDI